MQKAGWELVRMRGSHRSYRREGRQETFSYHDGDNLGGPAIGLVAKQFGLTVDELRRLL